MKKKWGIIMLKLLGTEELKNILNFEYSKNTVLKNSKMYREFNVKAFNSISRINLQYGKRERRVCLYETLNGEKIYIQYPGKESVGKRQQMPYDFRPEIEMKDGTFISDAAFGDIWDILSEIGNEQKKELPFVYPKMTEFLRKILYNKTGQEWPLSRFFERMTEYAPLSEQL